MAKLKGNQRKVVGKNVKAANIQNGNPKRVQVYTVSKEAGEKVKGAIAGAYPKFKFYKSENTSMNVVGHVIGQILTGGLSNVAQAAANTWKNFSVECDSSKNAEKLVEDIGDCVEEYGYQEPAQAGASGNYGDPTKTDNEEEGSGLGLSKTTIFIILALLAVIVALLIIKRKKK